MNINPSSQPQSPAAEKAEITIPAGLIGLPHLTRFDILADPSLYPLVVLRHTGEEEIDYFAVDPSIVFKTYNMVIPDADAEELGLAAGGEIPMILNIAIIKSNDPKMITANLQAPIIINRQTGIGKQILLENAESYSVEQALDL